MIQESATPCERLRRGAAARRDAFADSQTSAPLLATAKAAAKNGESGLEIPLPKRLFFAHTHISLFILPNPFPDPQMYTCN
ncbi:hypothetical protein L596_010896 [Steinernema carpocapsae]|uniref:Uncharacterized protein n=1 Tax=Steinernema carpocapsae TaxID=34508 RepID=A0A4V6A710_STECR|nr:hypothetical protein L596_010896 [Steinernema carpocapsae]